MSKENINQNKSKTNYPLIAFTIFFLLVLLILWLPHPDKEQTKCAVCTNQLKHLGIAFAIYFEHTGSYPTPEKWCDLLISEMEKSWKSGQIEKSLQCPEAEIRDVNCHYAMNPNCTSPKNSSMNTVLLFETKSGGWNLTGGPELLTTENHKEKVCNVLFNDGSVQRTKKEEIPNLRWNAEKK